jgi:hypothetical protein
MSSDVNYEDVLNEAVGGGNNPAPAAIAAAPLPGRKAGESYKLVAPGTKPVGPRQAGAGACEAIHADKRNLLTTHGRTTLRGAFLAQALLTPVNANGTEMNHQIRVNDLVLTGLRFLSPMPLKPGTVLQLRTTGNDDAKLASAIRVVSTKVRPDGQFDVTAEFY